MGGEYGSADLASIMRAITKYTTVATTPGEVVHGTRLAIKHALAGRPGPACVLIRWNATQGEVDLETLLPRLYPLEGYLRVSPPCISARDAERVAGLLASAVQPVMIAGRGVHASAAHEEVRELAELVGMPVATSYMGKSAIAETHDLALGTMGNIGQRAANEAVSGADLLLAVGTGLSPENTRMLSPDYIDPRRQAIVHIDIDPRNAGWTFPVSLGVTSDARLALRAIIDALRARGVAADAPRLRAVKELKAKSGFFESDDFASERSPLAPERIVRELNEAVGADDLLVLDAGNNRMWCSKLFRSKRAGRARRPPRAPGAEGGLRLRRRRDDDDALCPRNGPPVRAARDLRGDEQRLPGQRAGPPTGGSDDRHRVPPRRFLGDRPRHGLRRREGRKAVGAPARARGGARQRAAVGRRRRHRQGPSLQADGVLIPRCGNAETTSM
jgi:acetolactate synthase-1/2/3 large subunit